LRDLLHGTSKRQFGAAAAAALYAVAAAIFTWPLALGLARDIPADLGDPLLNAWILAWDADHLLRFFSGDLVALREFWNANIFYPEPLTLAYSEHLFAQAFQILPVYAITGNIILSYNLLFLSTFVLSGLGMYLFVRESTGSRCAGFAAGLIYAFAPYRVPQFSHVQVLSSQWMPFALYGLRRYFGGITTRPRYWKRVRPLAAAGAALVAQNLSNGYFLLFFAPFIVAYALYEIGTRKLWNNTHMWLALSVTAAAVAVLTVPFLIPYLELRAHGVGMRSLNEVKSFSADVFSYAMAPPQSRLWGGRLHGYPKPEGQLFPTFTALVLAAVGLATSLAVAWRQSRGPAVASSPKLLPVVSLLIGAGVVAAASLALVLSGHGFTHLGPLPVSVRTLWPAFRVLVAATALLLVLSPRARAFARGWTHQGVAFAVLAAAAAFLLSLGPEIRTEGRLIAAAGP
jgi:hypothetical protein